MEGCIGRRGRIDSRPVSRQTAEPDLERRRNQNASMAASTFDAKREVYRNSPIGMTRRLADENDWNEEALERRAEELAHCVLGRWPWVDLATVPHEAEGASGRLRWRIEGGPWHTELAASQMVLNVAGALLSRDPANAQKLSGDAIRPNVHLANRHPPGTAAGTLTMRAIPGPWSVRAVSIRTGLSRKCGAVPEDGQALRCDGRSIGPRN